MSTALLYDGDGAFTTSVVKRLRDTLGVEYGEKIYSKSGLSLTLSHTGASGGGSDASGSLDTVWTP